MYIEKLLNERKIPSLMTLSSGERVKDAETFAIRREEIKEILQTEEYGRIPAAPDEMKVEVTAEPNNFIAGKAIRKDLLFTVTADGVTRSFPVTQVVPRGEGKHPAFVSINFSDDAPDRFFPIEEIIDGGFAVFSFCHNTATTDDGDFSTGVAPLFVRGERTGDDAGKIAIWAWCAMRVMDYVGTLDFIDLDNVAVIGHSRLGKTALLAGGFDERFKYVISNDSGCSGAAISRGKAGESVQTITSVFPFWFCPNYVNNAEKFDTGNYDQHFLLALAAPRYLIVGSAEEDAWADPESEFLAAYAASEAFTLLGGKGLVTEDKVPSAKCVLSEGNVVYQLRHGTHWLSRDDWQEYMRVIHTAMGYALFS